MRESLQPGQQSNVPAWQSRESDESGTLEWSVMASVLCTSQCDYEVQLETETKAFPRPYNALEI